MALASRSTGGGLHDVAGRYSLARREALCYLQHALPLCQSTRLDRPLFDLLHTRNCKAPRGLTRFVTETCVSRKPRLLTRSTEHPLAKVAHVHLGRSPQSASGPGKECQRVSPRGGCLRGWWGVAPPCRIMGPPPRAAALHDLSSGSRVFIDNSVAIRNYMFDSCSSTCSRQLMSCTSNELKSKV